MIAVAVLLGFFIACGHDNNQSETKQQPVYEEVLQGVVITPVTVPFNYEAVGTIRAKTKAALSSKISGQIKQMKVDEGTRVQAGPAGVYR